MKEILVVGCGGFIGAVCRALLAKAVQDRAAGDFPAGTLAVNLLGCFIIGLLMVAAEREARFMTPEAKALLVTGLLGSLTTFSTFGHETLMLMRDQHYSLALSNVLTNVCTGLLAVAGGRALGGKLF